MEAAGLEVLLVTPDPNAGDGHGDQVAQEALEEVEVDGHDDDVDRGVRGRGVGRGRRGRGRVRVRGGGARGAATGGAGPQQQQPRRRRAQPLPLRGVGDPDELRALKKFFEEQARREDFFQIVEAKLASKEYVAVEKTGSRTTSVAWTTFREVIDVRSTLPVGANICSLCKFLVRALSDASTTTMRRHQSMRCLVEEGGEASGSGGSGSSSSTNRVRRRPPAPPGAKKLATRLATVTCAEGMLSFDAVVSGAIKDLCQGMVDIGSQYGPVDISDVMPCATTLSEHVKKEAAALRKEETVPLVKEAIAAGACSATVDEWTEDNTKQQFLSFVVHFVREGEMETAYLLTISFNADDASAESIRAAMLEALLELGISEEEVKGITFITDNGSNIVKALEDFKRHYCMCHAINICIQSGMSIRYHDLIRRCLQSVPRAMNVITACDEAVRFVKDFKRAPRHLRRVQKRLHKSKRQHQSYTKMLHSLRIHFNDVAAFLRGVGEEQKLQDIDVAEIDDLLMFLAPLDFDADREKNSAVVTLTAWPNLKLHAQLEVEGEGEGQDDEELSAMVIALKVALGNELHLMEIIEQVELCKKLVKYLKQSNLSARLSKTVKQEIDVRWNSIATMLQSIDDVWDEIVALLGEEQKARIEKIQRDTIKSLLKFLAPFSEESKKLEGEDYPTLPMAMLATYRLKRCCRVAVETDEPESFVLLRRNVLVHLEETIQLTMEHKMSTVLHPGFKTISMLSEDERNEVFEALRVKAASMQEDPAERDQVPPTKKSKLDADYDDWSCDAAADDGVPSSPSGEFSSYAAAVDELERYLRDAKPTSSEDLLKWWANEGAAYPRLQVVANRLLPIPASSASSERLFSKCGFIMNPRRNSLSGASLDALIFLQQYYRKRRKRRAAQSQ